MRYKKVQFTIKLLLPLLVSVLTYWVGTYFTGGDQIAYNKTYEGLNGLSFIDGYKYYVLSLSSFEVVHFILVWFFSNIGLEKLVLMSTANALLAYTFIALLQKWKVKVSLTLVLIVSNFYFIVLYFSAERLKFGVLFLLLSILYLENRKKNYVFSFLAILGHVQNIIIYGSIIFKIFVESILKLIIRLKISKKSLIMLVLFILSLFVMSEQVINKILRYSSVHGPEEFVKTFLFFAMSLYYSKNKQETFLIYIPILIAIFIVGEDRINMISYLIFLYYALKVNNGFNFGVILTTLYFSYKSIEFITNIFYYGNGFYRI